MGCAASQATPPAAAAQSEGDDTMFSPTYTMARLSIKEKSNNIRQKPKSIYTTSSKHHKSTASPLTHTPTVMTPLSPPSAAPMSPPPIFSAYAESPSHKKNNSLSNLDPVFMGQLALFKSQSLNRQSAHPHHHTHTHSMTSRINNNNASNEQHSSMPAHARAVSSQSTRLYQANGHQLKCTANT